MFYVYILYSEELDQTYVGYTSNLQKRTKEHKDGSTYTTSKANDYELVWYCVFLTKQLAMNFEKYLKSHSGRIMMSKRLITGIVNQRSSPANGVKRQETGALQHLLSVSPHCPW